MAAGGRVRGQAAGGADRSAGGGGLGDVIASGITISDRIVFVGAVMVAALALLADWALSLAERVAVPKRTSA